MEPQQIVKSGNVDLAVYAWGSHGEKPTIVMVHGYPDSARVWTACAEMLKARYHVIAYDVRGAGRSSRPRRIADYALDHLVSDLGAVIDAVSPQRPVHLVCHDWGSIQCWEAVTTAALQNRIASYTSISGPSLDHAGHWVAQRLKSGTPKKIAQVARQFARSWYVFMFQLPMLAPAAWKLGLGKRWPAILHKTEGFRPPPSATQTQDGCDGVKLYRANFFSRVFAPHQRHTGLPVQLIVPARDPFMVPEIWDDLAQWVPRLWRRDIDAGHWLPLSHPQQVAAWAAEFAEFVDSGVESAALKRARRSA